MQVAIVVSVKDVAGMNMKEALLATGLFEKSPAEPKPPYDADSVYVFTKNQSHKLYTLSCESIHAEELDKQVHADFFLFATRHQGAAQIPSLSCHAIGNFGMAELGGLDGTLVPAPAQYLRYCLDLMQEPGAKLGWEVVQEATHHGPFLEKPTMFIEIGSTKAEWENKDAAKLQAQVILKLITTNPPAYDAAIGFGGQHTMTNLLKVMARSNLAFGHVAAKYAMPSITEGLIEEMLEKTKGAVAASQQMSAQGRPLIVFDWKGMGVRKQDVLAMVEKLGYPFKYVDDFEK